MYYVEAIGKERDVTTTLRLKKAATDSMGRERDVVIEEIPVGREDVRPVLDYLMDVTVRWNREESPCA